MGSLSIVMGCSLGFGWFWFSPTIVPGFVCLSSLLVFFLILLLERMGGSARIYFVFFKDVGMYIYVWESGDLMKRRQWNTEN